MTTAIYVITPGQARAPHVRLALGRLAAMADRVMVVADGADAAAARAVAGDGVLLFRGGTLTPGAGYRHAILHLAETGELGGEGLILTGSQAFGPTGAAPPVAGDLEAQGIGLWSAYWHATGLDPRLTGRPRDERVPYLDFAVIAAGFAARPAFAGFWRDLRLDGNPWAEFQALSIGIGELLLREALRADYALPPDALETIDPRLFEVHRLVRAGAPCVAAAVLTLDPLLQDLNAIELRPAIDHLRGADPELYAALIDFALRNVPLRDFCTVADQVEVIPETDARPGRNSWAMGEVAVFIHAYYAQMMPEFWRLVERLPCAHHLYITTASAENRERIAEFLAGKGLAPDRCTLRVVEQNRGRDMSSLFITWRDIVLSGRHELALRLHSKRTPQVSPRVGESFKDHLFDNLVAGPGHVANLLDRLEAEPDIGLVIPPAIHVGFGTLGHSWFNNRAQVQAELAKMGISVPLDAHTPVAPYGTMYWFRTAALRPMFERAWTWTGYNPEPHHVDGGLAHVQERMIGYVCAGTGFRVLQVMTPRAAARGYARLEYKTQRLAASLLSGNVVLQVAELEARQAKQRVRVYLGLQQMYGRLLARWPGLRDTLGPARRLVQRLLLPRPMR